MSEGEYSDDHYLDSVVAAQNSAPMIPGWAHKDPWWNIGSEIRGIPVVPILAGLVACAIFIWLLAIGLHTSSDW